MPIEKFEEIMNVLIEFEKESDELYSHHGISLFDNGPIVKCCYWLRKLLKEQMNDTYEWIDYYLYECDYGKDTDTMKVFDKDDNPIPLKTLEDLYKLIKDK